MGSCHSIEQESAFFKPQPNLTQVCPVGLQQGREFLNREWFVGQIARADAVTFLMSRGVGAFLIRNSMNWDGEFCLSVKAPSGRVKHYRIMHSKENGYCLAEIPTFDTLDDLVGYYKEGANGLCAALIVVDGTRSGPLIKSGSLEIDRKSIKLIKKLDQGYFGTVYEGVWNGNVPIAVKVLINDTMMDADKFRLEAQLLKDLDHNNLIILYGVCIKEEPLYIVTELMRNGSLLKYLQAKKKTVKLSMNMLMDISSQVAAGMAYLEFKNCIHRDLAARNILVGDDNTFMVKIADFGMALWMLDQHSFIPRYQYESFPLKWTAPEAANGQKFSIKSDVWSYGVLLYEVVTHGDRPYLEMSNAETLKQVTAGYRMTQPRECPNNVYDVMQDCWQMNPQARPTFNALHKRMKSTCVPERAINSKTWFKWAV